MASYRFEGVTASTSLIALILTLLLSLQIVRVKAQDCSNPGGNATSTDCWNSLQVSQYVTDWWTDNSQICAEKNAGFGRCFMLSLNHSEVQCFGITYASCDSPSWTEYSGQGLNVKQYYVAYNIYRIWQFYNSYWLAIGAAQTLTSASVAAIVEYLDPVKETGASLNDILTVLASVIAVATPFLGIVGGAIATGIGQVPAVGKYLFPPGTINSQFQQFGSIMNDLGKVTENLQSNIASALSEIQGKDAATFLAFTGTGAFSASEVPSMEDQKDIIKDVMNTFTVSQALKQNKWQVSRAVDTDMRALMTNGTKVAYSIRGCQDNYYDGNGICGAYWFDKTRGVSYSITKSDEFHTNPIPIWETIISNNWAKPGILYDRAQHCKEGGKTAAEIVMNENGVEFLCIAPIDVCTWNQAGATRNPKGYTAEYNDCDDHAEYLQNAGCECSNMLPFSYAGVLLTTITIRNSFGPQCIVGYCRTGTEDYP